MMQSELAQARACFESGDLTRAEELFGRVLAEDSENRDALQGLGVLAIRAGKMQQAVDYVQRAIAADGTDANLQSHLGVALAELERNDEAVEAFQRAIELNPKLQDAYYNLAKVYQSTDRPEEAVTQYRAALAINANAPQIHYNLGNTLKDLERLDEAAAAYREAVRLRPGYLKALNNLGNILRDQGKLDEAAAQHREAIRQKPDYAEAHHNLGLVLTAQKKLDEAVASFHRALEFKPDFPAARNGLAKALVEQGKLDEATGILDAERELREDCLHTYLALSDKLRQEGRVEEAIACARKVLDAKADLALAHNSLGLALLSDNQLDEAITCYRRALEIKPDYAEVYSNLGVALHTLGQFEESIQHIETALRIKPQFPIAHLNRAVTWLRTGDLERGWHEFEWRWLCDNHRVQEFDKPAWTGQEMPEGTVLLHAEQGLGDTLQFIRYAPLVKQRCGTVVFQCQKPLELLLKRCPGVDQVIAKGDKLPDFDAQIPLVSLAGIFNTTLGTIPANVPYIYADDELLQLWQQRLAEHEGFKVGIAWQGNKKYAGDAYRSAPLRHFAALAKVPGVKFFSLQKGNGSDQLAELAEDFEIHDFGDEVDKEHGRFMDTAAIMRNLDLVITTDTATPHLAGALGVPVWVALSTASDWRWFENRKDSPWYPTMRLFRQMRLGDWDDLFERIAAELQAVVEGDRAKLRPAISVQCEPISAPVSPGELLDKLSILGIKSERITDEAKLGNVRRELAQLQAARDRAVGASEELAALSQQLKAVNEQLWQIEDEIRDCEARKDFGSRFVDLARAVYTTNDRRVALKRQIDTLLGSPLIEEKQHPAYE